MAKSGFDLATCARSNILALEPYRCARDDYKDDGRNVLLDANENAYGPGLVLDSTGKLVDPSSKSGPSIELNLKGLHRYPDPHQEELKELLCALRQYGSGPPLKPENLFVGNGSDEALDSLIRCFCVPGKDSVVVCPPTYGMYNVSSCVNDVEVFKVPQTAEFEIDVEALEQELTKNAQNAAGRHKILFLCSPGNPTGKLVRKVDVERLLNHPTFNGIVVVDEAYVDFSAPQSSMAPLATQYENLVVMQTLSKGFGLAGIRLGSVFASPGVAALLNAMKAPYNVSSLTSQLAIKAVSAENLELTRNHIAVAITQRDRLVHELPRVPGMGKVIGGLDANFLLVQVLDRPGGQPSSPIALRVYERLAGKLGVVVRFRGKELHCAGGLRITIGTEAENDRLLEALREALQAEQGASPVNGTRAEERKEDAENAVVS